MPFPELSLPVRDRAMAAGNREGPGTVARGRQSATRTRRWASPIVGVASSDWDTERLRDNDAAFSTPSATTVGRLRDTYRVRWLFADTTYSRVPPELGQYATLRYSRPGVRIYELR